VPSRSPGNAEKPSRGTERTRSIARRSTPQVWASSPAVR
jgi:hypothetical protein